MKYIYVAAKFERKAWVREVMQELRKEGFGIAHDWTSTDATHVGSANRSMYMQTCAAEDLEGIRRSHAMLVLHDPSNPGRGKYAEVGFGLALNKPIVYLNDDEGFIFWWLCTPKRTLADAIDYLKRILF